jgi:TonB family protein
MEANRDDGQPIKQLLMVTAEDSSRYKPANGAKDYIARIEEGLSRKAGTEITQHETPVEFGGRQFYSVEDREKSDRSEFYRALVATERSGYLLGWTFVAGSQAEVRAALSSLQQVAFREEGKEAPLESQPTQTLPIRICEEVSRPLVVKMFPAAYPPDAYIARIQVAVILSLVVSATGDVSDVKLVRGHPMLAASAVRAVTGWKYKPYVLNGQPVGMKTQATVVFRR